MKLTKLLNQTLNTQKGFTLIELMIVVGIIGILVTIAAPNFAKYQSKARQAEAKIGLAALYTAEKSFYSEYSAYLGSLDGIGYQPEGNRRFYGTGFAANHTTSPTGYAGTLLNGMNANANAPYTCTALNYAASALPAGLTGDSQTFTAGAVGCIRQGAASGDNWTINDTKVLSNTTVGL